MHTSRRRRPTPTTSLLALALLTALSMPAFAADVPCASGNPDTNQGHEDVDADPAKNTNTTCDANASAYGAGNYADGSTSSAFGWNNKATATGANNTMTATVANRSYMGSYTAYELELPSKRSMRVTVSNADRYADPFDVGDAVTASWAENAPMVIVD